MGRIQKLSGAIVNQIAAGEVVIQPCSVIKELVENSLDAGASRIEVHFDGGGADAIRIVDDGMGMEEEDLLLCIEAHATSKIQSAADLYKVVSCGFRGEALASIAEVSDFEIVSRTRDTDGALRLFRQGEGPWKVEAASRSPGTTVSMKNLFHNVPVRRRFLKSDRAETTNNLDVLRRLALSRPWVAMAVFHDGKEVFDLPADQSLEERVKDLAIFKKGLDFFQFEEEEGDLKVHGLVVAPPEHFGNGNKIHAYINKRPIKDRTLQQSLVKAFTSYIPDRRFPGGVVFVDMDPEEVDVNIHPTKSEVRFRQPDRIFRSIYAAVKDRLSDSAQIEDSMPTHTMVYKKSGMPKTVPMNRRYGGVYENRPDPFGAGSPVDGSKSPSLPGHLQPRNPEPFFNPSPEGEAPQNDPAPLFDPSPRHDSLREAAPSEEPVFQHDRSPKVYQLLERFILVEYDDHIALMDQHAIHERVLYNQLLHEDRKRHFVCQQLLTPVQLDLPENLDEVSEFVVDTFRSMGFELDFRLGERTVTVRGIPDFTSVEGGLTYLEEMFEELSQGLPPEKDDLRRHILDSAACRSAIKAGDRLTEDELKGIVAALETMDETQESCPHGRNAIWRISIEEANAMFNR